MFSLHPLSYTAKRLLQFIPTLLGVTLLTFILVQLAPGEPGALQADLAHNSVLDREGIQAWRHLRGLDQPILTQYFHWLTSFLKFDFGRSLVTDRPVRAMLFEALPPTMLLTGTALVMIYLLAIPLGIFSALRQGTRTDTVVTSTLFIAYAMPSFWTALLLITWFGDAGGLRLFPIRGLHSEGMEMASWFARFTDTLWHMILPVVCLSYPALARTSRYQRAATLDVLGQDFIRTARAKGLNRRQVIVRHVLKSSLVPVVTLLSVDLPWLMGGSVIIERIFTIPGMGMLTFDSILRRDYPVIVGVAALVGLLTLGSVLLGDLMAIWIDPRTRLQRPSA